MADIRQHPHDDDIDQEDVVVYADGNDREQRNAQVRLHIMLSSCRSKDAGTMFKGLHVA